MITKDQIVEQVLKENPNLKYLPKDKLHSLIVARYPEYSEENQKKKQQQLQQSMRTAETAQEPGGVEGTMVGGDIDNYSPHSRTLSDNWSVFDFIKKGVNISGTGMAKKIVTGEEIFDISDREFSFLEEVGAAANKIRGAAAKLDKRLLGPLALGVGAALGLKAIMGDEGYSASPMLSAGEVMDSGVATAIRRGELFAPREDNMPTPESLGGGPQNDMIQRPINTGETYFSRQNAYQIRGGISSASGIGGAMDMIMGMGGSGSIRINDTRRPLTANYIDRLLGE